MARYNPLKNLGPGTLVAAAFIGPGTVTTCTKAGVNFGFALIWALALSILATIVLQGMASRVGLISGKGLAQAVRSQLNNTWIKTGAVILIISAILVGNSAYQAGNISGGVLGLETVFHNPSIRIGDINLNGFALIFGVVAFIVLFIGSYKILERFLIVLVLLMSFSFIITAILTKPDLAALFKGTFIPHMPEGGLLTVMGLIGTTVVPYNLFLHASIVREKWHSENESIESQLKKSKKDTLISILLGGFVSMAIIISAAAVQTQEITNAGDLAKGLEPLFGNYARYFLGIGLFCAGITSAITAPIAAAYVARECFGWEKNLKSFKFRMVWIFVLFIGVIFASLGKKPLELIQFAQVTNGLLLPIIALFLLWIVNRSEVMKEYVNKRWQNVLGGTIIIIILGLTVKTFFLLFAG